MKKLLLPVLLVVGAIFAIQQIGRSYPGLIPSWYPNILLSHEARNYDVSMDFSQTSACPTPDSLKKQFATLHLECADQLSGLGDHVCWSDITRFNNIPAKDIAFFFADGKFNQLRIAFPTTSHNLIVETLTDKFGAARAFPRKIGSDDIMGWRTPSGTLATYANVPSRYKETIILWSSYRSSANSLAAREPATKVQALLTNAFVNAYADGEFCDGI